MEMGNKQGQREEEETEYQSLTVRDSLDKIDKENKQCMYGSMVIHKYSLLETHTVHFILLGQWPR